MGSNVLLETHSEDLACTEQTEYAAALSLHSSNNHLGLSESMTYEMQIL
jgi:hypothetical protein